MSSESKLFSISYCTLLTAIAAKLGWSEPIYNQISTSQTAMYVLLRQTNSPIAYYFAGLSKATQNESEEDAAEQAVDYLVQTRRVIVDDINREARQMYKACAQFYKDKATTLELNEDVPPRMSLSTVLDLKNQPLGNTQKIVSIDFWKLLLEIVAAFKINTTEVEDLVYDNGTHVCSLRIDWEDSYNKVRYFIGDCFPNLEEARRSLAKRTILCLQTVYGFRVKDGNYYGMIHAEMRFGLQRGRYVAAKDKLEKEMGSLAVLAPEQCATPEGPEYEVSGGETLSSPPKKLKTMWTDTTSSSTGKGTVGRLSNADTVLTRFGGEVAAGEVEGV